MARPSTYDPAYCEQVIEMGRQGYSVVEMAAEIGCHRESIEQNWPAAYPEFSEAFTLARLCSQAWWERQGRVNLVMAPMAGTFQASAWSRSMAARFPADWREKSETALTGANGGPIKSEHTIDTSTLTIDQLKAIASIPINGG